MIANEVREKIRNLRGDGLSYRGIVDTIKESMGIKVSYGGVYNIANSVNADNAEIDAEEAIKEECRIKAKKQWDKAYKKRVKDALNYMATAEEVRDIFIKALDEYEWPGLYQADYDDGLLKIERDSAIVFVGDLHYGRTTEQLIKNFSVMIQMLAELPHKEIHICFLGDLIESPRVTGIHEAQVLEMDTLGVSQALGCVEMIQSGISYLIKLGKKISISGVLGNHERMSKERDGDPERIVGCMMFEMLKKFFPDTSIEYEKGGILVRDITSNFHVIMAHGDNGFNKKSDTDIIQALGDGYRYNIIASGHWHSASMAQGNGYTRFKIPSLNIQSHYEKNIFIAKGRPGFVILEDWNGIPDLSFKYVL